MHEWGAKNVDGRPRGDCTVGGAEGAGGRLRVVGRLCG